MLIIAANNPAIRVPNPEPAKPAAVPEAEESSSTPAATEGVKVSISPDGFKAAGAVKSANADIDDSGLDDNVKQVLKMIRQLKQQIAEKMAELQAIAADKSLTPEQVQAKTANVQGAISSLQAGLMTAQISLAKAMKTMSADQALKAASLSM
ncbi:hypothetical protein ALP39_01661 [Pseudomonas marginalis pv. marginalis]|jgi:hypothetical protein|nr:hypothetical protein ALP39_01661 [Pseudomonas marginalis pv. marginalis]VVN60385.1 hypothetical protein PS687_03723 [Pseudomonas fluorescens]